jgi:hypothetical protein
VTAEQLFLDLRSAGVVLSIDRDGRLSFDGPDDVLTDDRLSVMRAHRNELLEVVDWFNQRAAVAQYEGGLSRADAERLAAVDLKCKTNLTQKQIAVPDPVEIEAGLGMRMGILSHKTNVQEKQIVAPERVEMPAGVRCPFCASRSWFADSSGCRCAECSRLAWVTLPSGGIVRADFANVAL